jgi:Putative transmembrane protein (PGPGW)
VARLSAVFRVTTGFVLLIIGGLLSLPGVPGPGLLVIALGLWLLSDHFVWARRTLDWGRQRFSELKRGRWRAADGQPRASTVAKE